MTGVHVALGVALLASSAAAGVWGGIAWFRKSPSRAFWYLLRTAQLLVVAEVTVGGAMYATGQRPAAEIHYVYGIAPLVVSFFGEAMRVGAAQREVADVGDFHELEESEQLAVARRILLREMGIMSVAALLILSLALRAAFTSPAV